MGRTAAVAVALCLVLAGCGSVKKQAPPMTRSAFRAQANRICMTAKTQSVRLAGLRTLRPPAGGEELYARWLKAEQDAVAVTRPHYRPPANVDRAVVLAIAEGEAVGYARRLGAEQCTKRTIGTMPP